jgi:hypothetical protein
MTTFVSRALLAAALLVLAGCERSKTIHIGIDPEPFDVVTGEGTSGIGTATIDPSLEAGSDYTDNREDIDEVMLRDLTLEIFSVNTSPTNGHPANQATELQTATLLVRDDVTQEAHAFTVDTSLLPLRIEAGLRHKLGVLVPAISSDTTGIDAFLTRILQAGNNFSVVASGAVDAAPVNITCRLLFDIDLEVKVSFP